MKTLVEAISSVDFGYKPKHILYPEEPEGNLQLHHDILKKHYDESHYSNDQQNAIDTYTSHSHDINSYLWKKHRSEPITFPVFKNNRPNPIIDVADHLHDAVRLRKTPIAMNVWSGTPHNVEKMKDENNIVHHPAFLSTTLHVGRTKTFFHPTYSHEDKEHLVHVLKIHVPKDSPGLYTSGDGLKGLRSEREFIIPDGSNLKHIRTKTYKTTDGFRIHIHHLHLNK